MKKILGWLLCMVLAAGDAGAQVAIGRCEAAAAISVSVAAVPSSGVSGTPTVLTATVTNDVGNQGVSWSAVPCGTVTGDNIHELYWTTTGCSTGDQTVTATSRADNTKTGIGTFTVTPGGATYGNSKTWSQSNSSSPTAFTNFDAGSAVLVVLGCVNHSTSSGSYIDATAATWNGISMHKQGGYRGITVWYAKTSDGTITGTHDFSLTDTNYPVCTAYSFTAANQTTPMGSLIGLNFNVSSYTASSGPGEIVLDFFILNIASTHSCTPTGTGQTSVGKGADTFFDEGICSSYTPGATNVSNGWSSPGDSTGAYITVKP